MDEGTRIERWLYDTCVADATLAGLVATRVYNSIAPPGTAFPYIRFQKLSGVDVNCLGAQRLGHDAVYYLGVCTEGEDQAPLEPILDRLDALFRKVENVIYGGLRINTRRLGTVGPVVPPVIAGKQYPERGYRLMVWAAAA